MKCKHNHLYLKIALILSGDINLKLGPVTRHQINNPKFDAFNSKGLHLLNLNINSLLPKIDRLCNIAKSSNAVEIRKTETKLDNTSHDSCITTDRYSGVKTQ